MVKHSNVGKAPIVWQPEMKQQHSECFQRVVKCISCWICIAAGLHVLLNDFEVWMLVHVSNVPVTLVQPGLQPSSVRKSSVKWGITDTQNWISIGMATNCVCVSQHFQLHRLLWHCHCLSKDLQPNNKGQVQFKPQQQLTHECTCEYHS